MMLSSKHRWIVETICFGLISIYLAHLWFRPIMWQLGEGEYTFWGALESIFIRTDVRENLYGTGVDLQGTIWVFDKLSEILSGASSSFLPEIYAPIGFDLGLNEGFAWADGLFAWPLIQLIETPGWYNLHVLLTLAGSYFGCMILFRNTGAPFLVSIGLGLLCVTHAFGRQELLQGRPTQMHWILSALFLLCVVKILAPKANWLWAVFGGLCGAGMMLVYWFGGAAVGFCAAAVLLFMGLQETNRLRRIGQALLMATLSIAIPIAVTWRVSSQILQGSGSSLFESMSEEPAYLISAPLLDIPIQKFIWITSQEDLFRVLTSAMFPLPLLVLGALFIFNPFGWKRSWGWFLGVLLAIGIPIGPSLIWDGGWLVTGHALLQAVFPPLLRCAFPHRMVVAPILFIGLFIAMSSSSLIKKMPHPFLKIALTLGLSSLMIQQASLQFPDHLTTPHSHIAPDFHLLSATKRWPGGVITIPLEQGSDTAHIQQMFHNQPLLGGPGMDVVRPKEHKAYCDKNTLLQALEQLVQRNLNNTPGYKEADLEQLWKDGFRLVYIETRRTQGDVEDFQNLLGAKGSYQQGAGQLAIPLPKPKSLEETQ
ncbi:MAG: hypothetical protein CMK59_10990 [Proteobacteria bacterium]|nr:hypothetical protein [Pseudomonadota bacterium]